MHSYDYHARLEGARIVTNVRAGPHSWEGHVLRSLRLAADRASRA